MPEGPLTTEELGLSLERLEISASAPLAVAVSGGADSMSLAVLLHSIRPIFALIVDHGLRAESAGEARDTQERLTSLGIDSEILVWDHDEIPTANVQAAAREARYALMRDWCVDHNTQFLCTAHHMDDQAETVLLRLARGSGVYGLAGMAPMRDLGKGVMLARPLLNVPKKRLVAVLNELKVGWIDDPSNSNVAFDRVKVRNLLQAPPLEGLQAARLSATAERLRRSRNALEFFQQRWLEDSVEFFEAGYALLDKRKFSEVPEDVYLRALNSVIQFSGGGGYAPRFEKLLRLAEALLDDNFKGHTLRGVRFSPVLKQGMAHQIIVTREKTALESAKLVSNEYTVWDGRFSIDASRIRLGEGLYVGPLADAARRLNGENLTHFQKLTDKVPKLALHTLPAFFLEERLIAVPHLGYTVGGIKLPDLSHQRLTLSENGKKIYDGMQ